jgi:hypothetical protein
MISKWTPRFNKNYPSFKANELVGDGGFKDMGIVANAFEYSVLDPDGLLSVGGFIYNGVGNPSGTTANVANTLLFTPFVVRQSVWIDQLVFATVTGTNGSVVMGIYDTKDGKPYKKIVQTDAVGTTADNTLYTTTFTASTKFMLKPGVYWVARNATTTKALSGFTAGNALATLQPVTTDLTSFLTLTQRTGYSVASAYNATLPSYAPTVSTTITTSIPALGMRIHSIPEPTNSYAVK